MFRGDTTLYEFRGPCGVPVHIAPTILLILILFLDFGGTPRELAYDLCFSAMLIGSIFLHELGHAWGALIQRLPVSKIVLHGFGGYCQQARTSTPRESELIVAMGPIVTLVLWAVSRLTADMLWASGMEYNNILWALETMAWLNGYLAIFNLLPISPLDGGKLFELALLRVTGADRASQIAGYVGMAGLVIFIPFMVLGLDMYLFVIFFLPAFAVNWSKMRGQFA